MLANRLVTIASDCVLTDRPGETNIHLEGARLSATEDLPVVEITRQAAGDLERILAEHPDARLAGLFDMDGLRISRVIWAKRAAPSIRIVAMSPHPKAELGILPQAA